MAFTIPAECRRLALLNLPNLLIFLRTSFTGASFCLRFTTKSDVCRVCFLSQRAKTASQQSLSLRNARGQKKTGQDTLRSWQMTRMTQQPECGRPRPSAATSVVTQWPFLVLQRLGKEANDDSQSSSVVQGNENWGKVKGRQKEGSEKTKGAIPPKTEANFHLFHLFTVGEISDYVDYRIRFTLVWRKCLSQCGICKSSTSSV